MKQYKLIETYPGSPPLGTIVEKKESDNLIYNSIGEHTYYLAKYIIEENPKFWEKVKEKTIIKEDSKDYQILSLSYFSHITPFRIYDKSKNNIHFYNDNGQCVSINAFKRPIGCSANVKIHSVKRLSDGEVFTIGDQVCRNKSWETQSPCIIINFELKNNKLFVNIKQNQTAIYPFDNIMYKYIPKKPIFTTEDDVDIFEGDTYHYVYNNKNYHNNKIYTANIKCEKTWLRINVLSRYKRFSAKEKAQEYLDSLNKPEKLLTFPKLESKKEYEILSFKTESGQISKLQSNNKYFVESSGQKFEPNGYFCGYTVEQELNINSTIYSIKRLSDGQIFTVDDKIDSKHKIWNDVFITGFEISDLIGLGVRNTSKGLHPIENIKHSEVKSQIFNKIVSFGPNANTGGIYTYNKNTNLYHSNISDAQIPFKECLERYPIKRVMNSERNILTIGDYIKRLDTKTNTNFSIRGFKTENNKIIATLRKGHGAFRYVEIDNLEHCV